MEEDFEESSDKELKEEIESLRNSIDNCLPIDKLENEDVWQKINELINLEIKLEQRCNS